MALYLDQLVHVPSWIARLTPVLGISLTKSAIADGFERQIAAHDESVTAIPLASIANIHRRSSSDDGFCVVTAAGDEYRFWGGDHYDVSYDEWSQMLRKAAESNGNRLPRRTTSRQ